MRIAYVVLRDLHGSASETSAEQVAVVQRTVRALGEAGHAVLLASLGDDIDGKTPGGPRDDTRDDPRDDTLDAPGPPASSVRAATPRALVRAVAEAGPAVVHLNGLDAATVALGLRRRLGRRVRVVVQHHGEAPGRGTGLLAQRFAGRFVAGYLFTGGEAAASLWRTAGVVRPDVPVFDVVECGSDLHPVPGEVLHGDPAVVWIGRDTPTKDLDTAVRAVERLGMRATLHVIEPTDRPPDDGLARILTGASVFLSTSHHEAAARGVVHARACGVPLALSDIPAHRSIAPEAHFFAPGDADGAAEAIRRAAVAPRQPRRWTWADVAHQLGDIYARVMR